MTLRILHLAASHRWTGVAEPAARLARAEAALGHDVLFAMAPGGSFEKQTRALGVATCADVPFNRTWWPHHKLGNLRALRVLVARFRPDIVHAHLTHDHVLAAIALRGSGAPALVRTFHRETPPRGDFFTRRVVMARTAGALAVSSSLRSELLRQFSLPPDRVARINGVFDAARFGPDAGRGAAMRERWGIPAEAPVVGIVSRIRVERGFAWLLDAAERALSLRQDAWLVICGRGNWQAAMLERLESHPARERIVYAGYVQGDDLPDSYRAFDVSLLLKPGNDGACRAALEAMACAKPVIGGRIGAMRDLIEDCGGGWLVPEDDAAALADAMIHACTAAGERRERGEQARTHVLTHCTEEAQARAVTTFYERLL